MKSGAAFKMVHRLQRCVALINIIIEHEEQFIVFRGEISFKVKFGQALHEKGLSVVCSQGR